MNQKLKIIHCFRSPVGGIFRHVRDLLQQQSLAGHEVGIICDSNTGSAYEDKLFQKIDPMLALGLHRIPMPRSIAPQDLSALLKTRRILSSIMPDVVHSHSAKGGVYGRLGSRLASNRSHRIKAFYCPHGGAMHYKAGSLKGKVFFAAERFLERMTDSLIFVSDYERKAYREKVGEPTCPASIVYNGISPEEFVPVKPKSDAVDFLYIGMKRDLKGADVFLDALHIIKHEKRHDVSAWFVGDGPDEEKYDKQIERLQLGDSVFVSNAIPARAAFELAKIVVVPSRAESMPYLVLEALAAQIPMVATNVGGIPEIFDGDKDQLIEPGNAEHLANAMVGMMNNKRRVQEAKKIADRLADRFSLNAMSEGIEKLYFS